MTNMMKPVMRALGISLAIGAVALCADFVMGSGKAVVAPQALAQADEPTNLRDLLRRVREGRIRDNEENRRREAEFQRQVNERRALLQRAEADLEAARARTEELEQRRTENETELATLETQLQEALGEFGELFGVVRQVASDTIGQFQDSMISAQFPNRAQELEVLTRSRVLPTLPQLETLWYLMLQEATEQGRNVRFDSIVFDTDGKQTTQEVIRIGVMTAMLADGGEFVTYANQAREKGVSVESFKELQRQPGARFRGAASSYVSAQPDTLSEVAIDPSRGQLLGLLIQTPDLVERINQGAEVGYIIIAIGVIGALLAILRFFQLLVTSMAVNRQAKKGTGSKGNPLGRVFLVYEENKKTDEKTLELKLDEAVLKELPRLEFGLPTIKVMAAVAPLLGLLGTVTGMIIVFQSITLFGTGDPKLMAGGISQALITTVLGLTVAIPLLLLHSLANGQYKSVAQKLDEQSAGLIAKRAEEKAKG